MRDDGYVVKNIVNDKLVGPLINGMVVAAIFKTMDEAMEFKAYVVNQIPNGNQLVVVPVSIVDRID